MQFWDQRKKNGILSKITPFFPPFQVVVKTEDAEAKPEDEAAADKPKPPKKFNVDEHFNNELHAIMKYLFPGLMPNEQEVVKNTENFFKKKSSGKRKRVENENSTNDQETDVVS